MEEDYEDNDSDFYDEELDDCGNPDCEECKELRLKAEKKQGVPLVISELNREELIETAQKDMTDARKTYEWDGRLTGSGATGGNNVLTGFISLEGKRRHEAYPCHRPINGFKDATTLWSAFGYRNKKEIAHLYHSWLINDSPWSKTGVIPESNPNDMFHSGFIFTELDQLSSNLLHNFLVATRMDAEWPLWIKGWYDLVTKHDVNHSLAFFMMTMFVAPGSMQPFTEVPESVLTHMDKYDWPLDVSRATEDYVWNFIQGNPVGLSKTPFSPTAKTAPVNTLWGKLSTLHEKDTYLIILRDLYEKEFSTLKKVTRNQMGSMVSVETNVYPFKNILEIIRREEIRLGLKGKEKKIVGSK